MPAGLFAEGKADRRERLRELILDRGSLMDDDEMDTMEEQAPAPVCLSRCHPIVLQSLLRANTYPTVAETIVCHIEGSVS
jgi:hypothetical protein